MPSCSKSRASALPCWAELEARRKILSSIARDGDVDEGLISTIPFESTYDLMLCIWALVSGPSTNLTPLESSERIFSVSVVELNCVSAKIRFILQEAPISSRYALKSDAPSLAATPLS